MKILFQLSLYLLVIRAMKVCQINNYRICNTVLKWEKKRYKSNKIKNHH